MDIKNLERNVWRNFNNAITLMCIIPFLAFLYLVTEKIVSPAMFGGEVTNVMLMVIAVFMAGILAGRQLIWKLINEIIEANWKIIKAQEELVSEKRLSAISQTVVTLSHEINNPLLVVSGNVELLQEKAEQETLRAKLSVIKENCEKIKHVLVKMTELTNPAVVPYGNLEMIDVEESE